MSDIKVTVHVNENVTETLREIKIGQLYDILNHTTSEEHKLTV